MGGGKDYKEGLNTQKTMRDTTWNQGNQLMTQGQGYVQQGTQLYQPMIDRLTALTSGNRNTITQQIAPQLGQIQQQQEQARANIDATAPAGAARTYAKASLERDAAGERAKAFNDSFLSAFPALAGFGDKYAQLGLQQEGAGLRSQEGAEKTASELTESARKRQADKWNAWTGLAKTGVGLATGGLSGFSGMGGGGGGTPYIDNGTWYSSGGVLQLPSSAVTNPTYGNGR